MDTPETRRNGPCWCGSGRKYKKCHMLSDARQDAPDARRVRKGAGMIKTPDEIEGMRAAGVFNGELMDHVRSFVTSGISTEAINRCVHEYTIAHGHTPACLNYHGFPKSACTSINNVVCHGIPSPDEILRDGDIVNIDLTTIVNGFYADSSEMFLIGKVTVEALRLVQATARALLLGIVAALPGKPLGAIAAAIEPYVKSEGYSVVRQYTGHGIGKGFHEEPFNVFHHIAEDCDDIILQPGMTLTIEPMVNMGSYQVTTDPVDKWTVRTRDGSLSAQFEHTILITESEPEVLTLTPSQRLAGKVIAIPGEP